MGDKEMRIALLASFAAAYSKYTFQLGLGRNKLDGF